MHWITGLVLTGAVLFHVVRALGWLEPGAMMVWPADLRDGWRATRRAFGGRAEAPRPGKYLLLQKLYHHAIALVLLTTIATGLLMMVKVDTPLWTRDPYWLSDQAWGAVYVLHGLAALISITLIMVHVYFAFRPEKLSLTRSMIRGWITASEYGLQHDPARRPIAGQTAARPRTPAQDRSAAD
jgi:thiosulfate reductase cytochrome b subunit